MLRLQHANSVLPRRFNVLNGNPGQFARDQPTSSALSREPRFDAGDRAPTVRARVQPARVEGYRGIHGPKRPYCAELIYRRLLTLIDVSRYGTGNLLKASITPSLRAARRRFERGVGKQGNPHSASLVVLWQRVIVGWNRQGFRDQGAGRHGGGGGSSRPAVVTWRWPWA